VHYLSREHLNEILLLPETDDRPDASVTPLAAAEETRMLTLPNGLKVLMIKDSSTPTLAAHFAVFGGLRYEDDVSSGSSRLVAKLLEKGTASMDQAEVQEAVEGWGGGLGSFSGQNSYGLTITSLSAHTSEALALFAELLTAPALDPAEFTKERDLQIEHVFAKKEDVFSFAQEALRKALYKTHPYRLDPLGSEESLKNLTRDRIVSFYKKTMSANRAVLSISGDFDPAKLEAQIRSLFAKLPVNSEAVELSASEKIDKPVIVRRESPREQAIVMLGFHAVAVTDARRHALEILNAVLNDSAGRLYKTVRSKAGLSYLVGSSLAMGVDPGYLVFFASVRPDKADEAMAMLVEEAELLRKDGITAVELADAKTQLIGNRERLLESKESRSLESAFSELYGISIEEFNRYAERVRAVSLEDIRAAIAQFIDPEHSARVTVVPETEKSNG